MVATGPPVPCKQVIHHSVGELLMMVMEKHQIENRTRDPAEPQPSAKFSSDVTLPWGPWREAFTNLIKPTKCMCGRKSEHSLGRDVMHSCMAFGFRTYLCLTV